jgi:hypothetical protein
MSNCHLNDDENQPVASSSGTQNHGSSDNYGPIQNTDRLVFPHMVSTDVKDSIIWEAQDFLEEHNIETEVIS